MKYVLNPIYNLYSNNIIICATIVMHHGHHFCQKVGFLIDTVRQSQYWPTNAEVEDVINEVSITFSLASSPSTFYSNISLR